MAIWLGILLMLVPFYHYYGVGFENPGEEEHLGEEEEESGDGDGSKTKANQTPLWKYVSSPEARKWGGTTKFTCLHCKNTYTGSYIRARKHLCGKMPWDGDKQVGIKTCVSVTTQQRAKYIREEEETEYKSKRSKGDFEHDSSQSHRQRTPSTFSYGSGYGDIGTNIALRRRTISDFLDEGCTNDVD